MPSEFAARGPRLPTGAGPCTCIKTREGEGFKRRLTREHAVNFIRRDLTQDAGEETPRLKAR
jgi:hypothetical protein